MQHQNVKMSKHRSSATKTRKFSRWDMSASQRKSMSLHDLTESPIDTSLGNAKFHQNPSLLTLDSIPKSRDSGLSRSASHLSLGSIGPVLVETPRSPTKCELKSNVRELEKKLKENKKLLREKDEIIKEQKIMYEILFTDHQNLKLQFARYQNDVDRLRVEMYSNKSPPQQNFFARRRRSRTADGASTSQRQLLREDLPLRQSLLFETSQLGQTESLGTTNVSAATTTTLSPSSDEDSRDDSVELQEKKGCSEASSAADQVAPSSIFSSVLGHHDLHLQPVQPQQLTSLASSKREEFVSSPAPSSRWTLDKSFQLVSDSDRSEHAEESPTNESMSTEETAMISASKSEETLKAEHDDEVCSTDLAHIPPASRASSIDVGDNAHLLIHKLPEESSHLKVRRWQDAHNLIQKTPDPTWKICHRRPQNLNLSCSPMIQRLRSPQNLSLLSPRPFQKQASVPCLFKNHAELLSFIPPLDLSALRTETSCSAGEEISDSRSGSNSLRSKENIRRVLALNRPLDKMLRKAEKNLYLSQAVMHNLELGHRSSPE